MVSSVITLKRVGTKRYEAGRFQDRDPIITDLITAMNDSGLTDGEIAAKAMCSWQTVDNIRVKTKRPWNMTVDRILKACGFKRVLVRI